MPGAIRSRRVLTRKPLNRSRSGDGLLRPRRTPKGRPSPFVAVMAVFLVLVVLAVVATVQHAGAVQESFGSIRKRQLMDYYQAHNSDEQPPDEEEEEEEDSDEEPAYDGGRYQESADEEETKQIEEQIEAAEEEIQVEEAAEREEARRQQEREDQIRREKDEQLERLKEEKERLERQLREEEEQRKRAEEAAREAARLKEEEEKRKEEELARLKKLEEERESERLEMVRKEEERLREEEAKRRQQAEEARRQRQVEQEMQIKKQREEEERLRQEQKARLEAQRQHEHAQKASVHLQPRPPKQQNSIRGAAGAPGQQATIHFCDFMRKKPSDIDMGGEQGFSNPAVLVLGMEDSSTDLVWHVISQILYPGRKTAQRTHEMHTKATAIDYGLLDKMGLDPQIEFWAKVSDKSKGKWLAHVFCQQQENDVAAGFPWITAPDKITDNHKAQDTLDLIKKLPEGSLKILRVKRNPLDVLIRQAQKQQQAKGGAPIQLDRKTIFAQLRKLQSEQNAVDAFLQKNNIPHLTLDFETLFPFDHWTNLVQSLQSFQPKSDHINVDWRHLSSQLEGTWRDVLRYLKVYRPLSMFDILQYAMQTHEVNTFWIQKDAVDKFGYISAALQGTHFFPYVRKIRTETKFKNTQKFNDFWGEGDEM